MVSQAVEEYRFAILELSPATQTWYARRLAVFAEWCASQSILLETITPAVIRRYIASLRDRENQGKGKGGSLASSTIHGHMRAIRTFLRWCEAEDLALSSRAFKNVKMPHIEDKVLEIYTTAQLQALFAACSQEFYPGLVSRDQAILSVLLDTGIRAGELCDLLLENVHLTFGDSYLKVQGKGRKEREVPLGKKATRTLHTYLTRTRKGQATPDEQHVFLSRFHKPMTVNGLDQLLYRLQDWAHFKRHYGAHTFRHTYAVNYLRAGGDVFKLSRLLGHASVTITTDVYLKAFNALDARTDGPSVLDNL